MKKFLLALALLAAAGALRAGDTTGDITAVLAAQQAAWNRGALDGFMAGYVKSDDLRFASGGTITHGCRPSSSVTGNTTRTRRRWAPWPSATSS